MLQVLEGPILAHGPQGKEFETEFRAFLGEEAYCVAVSSCMAALHLSYLHFKIGPGDEVIVPAQTHVATVHAVEWVGARPVFADCDPKTGNLTVETITPLITARTKAISVVHFVGIPCQMREIMKLASQHGLRVIEDCAIALSSRVGQTHVGLFGDTGCLSFYPVKHITTGEGGLFFTRHPAVAESVSKLRAFGVDRSHSERTIPGMYDVVSLGLNYRMSEMQAALGRSQLRRLEENLKKRGQNFEVLKRALLSLPDLRVLDAQDSEQKNSHYCLVVVLEGRLGSYRDTIVARLNAAGIGTSIYYPQPVPRMKYYRDKYGDDTSRFPNALHLSDHSLALPVGPHVGEEDMKYIGEKFREILREASL